MPNWKVELFVFGPIAVIDQMRALREPKGRNPDDLFYTDINLLNNPSGVTITLTARADTKKLARRAALYYIGQALDILTLQLREPLYLSLIDEQPIRADRHHVRRIVEQDEWHNVFESARALNRSHTAYMRALSWYRKGLYTEDPFDKFLAFWNSIEIVASEYKPKGSCAKRGTKCYIWECFKLIWGECPEWPVVSGNTSWIDDNYNVRKDVAHGTMPVNIRRVERVVEKLETIEQVAHRFLVDWHASQI
jgi:hypothetical protein